VGKEKKVEGEGTLHESEVESKIPYPSNMGRAFGEKPIYGTSTVAAFGKERLSRSSVAELTIIPLGQEWSGETGPPQ